MTPSLSGEIKDEDADKARDIVLRAIDNLIIDCQRSHFLFFFFVLKKKVNKNFNK